ncbi:MAG TPA: NAD(P)/FAD-dependent oxidoreductase [Halococcus sp.]|nr:NAD(P)/FAD-dependent oxidoreductase [Halococcus sp.]
MQVAVIGSAVGGLAAAERCRSFATVDVYERKPTIGTPVNCGEGITAPNLIPLEKTPENGFVNRCPAFVAHVTPAREFGGTGECLARATLRCDDPAYITDRAVVERQWAERLRERGVTVQTGHAVTRDEFDEFTEEYDAVIDASGSPSLSSKTFGFANEYGESILALNADVEGDFSEFHPNAHVFFEGYAGYFWVFPKTPRRANVGIGWLQGAWPENYRDAFEAACVRNGVPAPDDANAYTIPMGPSLDAAYLAWPERGVYLVGDAAGIANRYQGEGIVQAIESASLLGDHLDAGTPERYPTALTERMHAEFRLSRLMTRAFRACVEGREFDLLAAVTHALSGLSPRTVTRDLRAVVTRILRHPTIVWRLCRLADPARTLRLLVECSRTSNR